MYVNLVCSYSPCTHMHVQYIYIYDYIFLFRLVLRHQIEVLALFFFIIFVLHLIHVCKINLSPCFLRHLVYRVEPYM